MSAVSSPSRQKSWRTGRERVSVLAELAIKKETVSRRLAELRDERDLSQEKAAALVGVTMRQWQRWEAGESVPYPRNLDAIAEHFGINVASFFEDDRPRVTDTNPQPSQLDRLEQKLDAQAELLRTMLEAIIPLLEDRERAQLEGLVAGKGEKTPEAPAESPRQT